MSRPIECKPVDEHPKTSRGQERPRIDVPAPLALSFQSSVSTEKRPVDKVYKPRLSDSGFRQFLMGYWPSLASKIWSFVERMEPTVDRSRKDSMMISSTSVVVQEKNAAVIDILLEAHEILKPDEFTELIEAQSVFTKPHIDFLEAYVEAAKARQRKRKRDKFTELIENSEMFDEEFHFKRKKQKEPRSRKPDTDGQDERLHQDVAHESKTKVVVLRPHGADSGNATTFERFQKSLRDRKEVTRKV